MATRDDNYGVMEDEAPAPKNPQAEMDGETALLPKSFFEGQELKPGQQYYVEIVREYEGEVEVRYPKKEKAEKPTKEADTALDEMATESPGNPGNPY